MSTAALVLALVALLAPLIAATARRVSPARVVAEVERPRRARPPEV